MAITPTDGKAVSNAVAANTMAFAAYSATVGRDIVVGVAMTNTANSILTITDTALNTFTLKKAVNGTGIRIEEWEAHGIAANAADVLLITLQLGQTDLMSAVFEEYSGAPTVGNTDSATGSNTYICQPIVTQDGNNFAVAILGFVCQAGDTYTAQCGTSRQSVVPALASVACALYDNTMVGDGTVVDMALISIARQWASAGLELRSGGGAITYVDYAATTAPALQVAKDVRYLRVLMPLGGGGSIAPPSGEGQFWPPPIVQQGS